jgi:hypothetical protein
MLKKSEDMYPSRSCLAMFLSFLLLAGLAACGPASSDNAPSLDSRAHASGSPLSKQSPLPRHDPSTTAATPMPHTSGNDPGATAGKRIVPGGNSPQAGSVSSTKPTDSVEPLIVPAWIAKELNSPDVGTRLRALETWAQTAPPGSVDPLILAYEDKDERVRTRAMELIEQDWARAADSDK